MKDKHTKFPVCDLLKDALIITVTCIDGSLWSGNLKDETNTLFYLQVLLIKKLKTLLKHFILGHWNQYYTGSKGILSIIRSFNRKLST